MRQQLYQVGREDCTRKVSGHALPFFLFFGGAMATNVEEPKGVVCQSDSDCSRALLDRAMCVLSQDASLPHGICQKSGSADNGSNVIRMFRRGPQTPACSSGTDCFASPTWPSMVLAAQKKSGKSKSKSGKSQGTATFTAILSTPSSLAEKQVDNGRGNPPTNTPNVRHIPTATASGHSLAPLEETAHASIDGDSAIELPVSHTGGMWIGIGASAVIAFLAMGVIFAFTSRVRRVRNSQNLSKKTSYSEMPAGFDSFRKNSTSDGKVAYMGGPMDGASYRPSNASLHSNQSTRSDRSFGNASSASSMTVRNPVFYPPVNAANSNGKLPLQPSETFRNSSSTRSNNSISSSKSQRIPERIQTPAMANVPPSLPTSTGVWTPAKEFRRPGPPLARNKSRLNPEESHSLPSSSASSSSGNSNLTTSSVNISMESSTFSQAPSSIYLHPGGIPISTNPPPAPFLITQADRIAIADRNKVRMFLHGFK